MNGQPTEIRSDVATTPDSDEEPPTPIGKRFVGQAVAIRLMFLVWGGECIPCPVS
jgi:hypothetical protein